MNNSLILKECVEEFKNENDLNSPYEDLFEIFCLSQINKKLNLTTDDLNNAIVDGSNDGGIDSFLILVDDSPINSEEEADAVELSNNSMLKVILGQTKNTNSFKEDVLNRIFISIDRMFDLEADITSEFNYQVAERTEWFRKLWRKSVRKSAEISLSFFYSCNANEINESDNFKRKKDQIIERTKKKVQNSNVEFKIYSASELLKLYTLKPVVELELKLKEIPVSVNYGANSIGYIGVAKIPDYLAFVTDSDGFIRESIFEENVRHYQGEIDVNKKIKTTLLSDQERDFWWLNNGVTIIASDVGQIGKDLSLKGVQIVNGLQTSFTIGRHYKDIENDTRSVLVKIIKSTDKTTIDKIISATNSQTAVNPSLLRATDDVQRKIELFFEQQGYFYDRRKNYYKNLGKPINKIFSIQGTAQAIHAILNYKPAESRAKPTTLIKTKESYDMIFRESINFKSYLNCCLVSRCINDIIKTNPICKEDKSLARLFSHHLYRIATAFITEKSHPTALDLENFNINKINDNLYSKCFEYLQNQIDAFTEESTTKNFTSISKSGRFDEFLSKSLVDRFNPSKRRTQ